MSGITTARRRRRATTMRTIRWHIAIPIDLASIVENAVWNRTLQKPSYGARNDFVVEAVREKIAREGLALLPPNT